MRFLIYGMIYLGSALMVYNKIGFIRFALRVGKSWGREKKILHIPIALLVMFLLGYLAVGIFGNPDIIVSGILFGGSVFVFVMYILLERITKRISENEKLEAKLMATEEANRSKTEFLSDVSHEMRTPLNVILGLDTIALKDPSLAFDTRDRLEKIGSSAKHLLGLINNILDMNSIETGEFVTKNEEFSLCGAVEQVNAIVETLCAEKGVSYTCTHSEDICGNYTGDEMRLKQILLSLLDNALKYTDKGGSVSLRVESCSDENNKNALRFTVSDTGVGIDEEFLPKIFGVFTKEDSSATSSHGGSGLGLAVTKSITELLGGSIGVESKKNVGSVFTVTLPMERAETNEEADHSRVSLDGIRVLIAEDIPENAEIVADLLELEGAVSEHAENGKAAVDMFLYSPPGYYDVILMDLRMPVMDGLSAARLIRSSDREDSGSVPIIALTANAFESDVKQSLDAGMNAHLAKPADSDLLYASIRKALSRKNSERSNEV